MDSSLICITDIKKCDDSPFLQPKRVFYTQNGIEKNWDILQIHDSVAVLIYHRSKQSFVFVKQFRPPVFLKNNDGFTYELCAGIMDKNLTPLQTAIEEVEEEVGFRVKKESMKLVSQHFMGVGFAGSMQTLFFTEVDEDMKVSEGGGDETEDIEVIYLPLSEAKNFLNNNTIATTLSLKMALFWYFENECN